MEKLDKSEKFDWKSIFDKDFLKNSLSVLGAALGAFLVYYIVTKLDKRKELKALEQKDARRLNYLSGILSSGKQQIEDFIGGLSDTVKALNTDDLNFVPLPQGTNLSLERLSNVLNDENYFTAYLEKYGEENLPKYQNISNAVDYFIAQEQQLAALSKQQQEENHTQKNQFLATVYDLLKRTLILVKEPALVPSDSHIPNEFSLEIHSIYDQYHSSFKDHSDLAYHYHKFILPMQERVLNKNTNNLEALELGTAYKNAATLYQNIRLKNQAYKEALSSTLNNHQNQIGVFETSASDLIGFLKEGDKEEVGDKKKEKTK